MIAADALSRRLLELGVKRIWGEALPGSDDRQVPLHVAVREADLAVLLADADGRIGEVDADRHSECSGELACRFEHVLESLPALT